MNTDTPRTNEALAAILDEDGYLSEDNVPDVLVKLTTALFGLELHPYQQRMVDMMLSTPEGVKWRLMVGRGRINSLLTKCERNKNES